MKRSVHMGSAVGRDDVDGAATLDSLYCVIRARIRGYGGPHSPQRIPSVQIS
jgi:hypothetical protein